MPLTQEDIFNSDQPVNFNEPHLAFALLLDTSGSMAGEPIARLNAGLKQFRDQLQMDEQAQKVVDICIITFNNSATLLQDFTPLPNMQIPTLSANGRTSMGAAINMAIDRVKERCHLYDSLGTPRYQPWIFMMTDGVPTDDVSMARQRIQSEENSGKAGRLKFWSCGIANDKKDNIDYATLKSFSKRVIELDNYDFSSLFQWIGGSISIISASGVEGVNSDTTQYEELPANAHVVPDVW